MTKIEIENLVKDYGDVTAVKGVSQEIPSGEFMTLVGPSGSGKSTILRTLAGLVEPTEGTIRFGGEDVTTKRPQEREVAMVFQNYALYPNMNVEENIAFPLKMHDVPKEERQERVDEVTKKLQISELKKRDIRELSGGQQQRVALGRSIVREPDVFLLDEPLANLDANLRVEMRSLLIELQRELGITTVYVTHNQLEAMTMSDQVAVVNLGEIQQVAAPDDLYNEPANEFVADFIGTPGMNFIDCELDTSTGVSIAFSFGEMTPQPTLEKTKNLTNLPSGNYTFGVRPQHIELTTDKNTKEQTPTATVDVIETAGREYIIHLSAGEHRILAVVDNRSDLSVGDTVNLSFDFPNSYLFDPETEEELSIPESKRQAATSLE